MAFSRISILLSTLILLIVFLFDHQPSTFVRAENQLIEDYDAPTACNQCVKAGNRSDDRTDTVGIDKIVVDCAEAHLQGNNSALATEVLDGALAANRSDDGADTVGIASIVVDCVRTQVAQLQGNKSALSSEVEDGGVVADNRSDDRTDAVGIAAIVVDCVKAQLQGNISALAASHVQDHFSANPTITQSRQELRNLSSTSPSPSPASTGVPYPYLVRNPNQFQPPPKAWHMPWWGYLLIGMGVISLVSLGIALIIWRNKGKVVKRWR